MTSQRRFVKNVPASGADLASAPIRDNFFALATDNAGPVAPESPEDGYTWLDTSLSSTPFLKVYFNGQWNTLFQYSPGLGKFIVLGASVNWGSIGGTITAQTDLQAALAGKLDLNPSGLTMVKAASNPGDERTLWINLLTGHLHRGSVDLEAQPSSITVSDAGGVVGTTDKLKFTGNVNVSTDGSQVTVNVPASAAGSYIQNQNAVGVKNGINTDFTVPGGLSYVPGSLIVFLNGMAYRPDSIVQNGPGYTTFTIFGDNVPQSDDTLAVSFFEA